MQKNILIGATALLITGTALIGSSIHAASGATSSTSLRWLGARNSTSIATSLSGTVSTEASTALQNLMDSYRTKMDALRSSSGATQEERTALMTEFQTAMEALKEQYPELENAMPQIGGGKMMWGGMMWGRGGRDSEDFGSGSGMNTAFSTLPTDVQDQITAVREKYRTQIEALRTQEQAEMSAILANYPEAQAQLESMGQRWGRNKGFAGSGTTTN